MQKARRSNTAKDSSAITKGGGVLWRVGNSIAQVLLNIIRHLAEAVGVQVLQGLAHWTMGPELQSSCKAIAPASLHTNSLLL